MPKPALFSECCGLGALAKFITRAHREEKRGKHILETKRAAHICDFGTVCVPKHGWWREGLFSRRLDLKLEDPESTHRFLLSDACIPSCFGIRAAVGVWQCSYAKAHRYLDFNPRGMLLGLHVCRKRRVSEKVRQQKTTIVIFSLQTLQPKTYILKFLRRAPPAPLESLSRRVLGSTRGPVGETLLSAACCGNGYGPLLVGLGQRRQRTLEAKNRRCV